jgi:hypothetical protein
MQKTIVPLDCSVLCAAFVPRFGLERATGISWQQHSQFYFLDSSQVNLFPFCICDSISLEKQVKVVPVVN